MAKVELSPQQKKERTFRALLDQLAGLAARGPVLALFEDVHWADPTTLELIGRVVETVQRKRRLTLAGRRQRSGRLTRPSAGSGELLCERRQELAAIMIAEPLR